MRKRGIPLLLTVPLLLGACMNTNNDALPRNDETPMENLEDRERNWTPDLREDQRGGSDIDGINEDEFQNEQRRNRNTINNDDPLNDLPGSGTNNAR